MLNYIKQYFTPTSSILTVLTLIGLVISQNSMLFLLFIISSIPFIFYPSRPGLFTGNLSGLSILFGSIILILGYIFFTPFFWIILIVLYVRALTQYSKSK